MKDIIKAFFTWLFSLFTKKKPEIINPTQSTMININCTIPSRKWNYKDIAIYVLSYLHIDNILLNIVENTAALDKLSPEDIEYQAILVKIDTHAYTLYARKGSFSPIVLCHELKHLEQYELNKLQLLPSKGYKWMGKEYEASYPYDSRPWEKEAFQAQNKLWKQYKQFKKNKKNETTKISV